MRWSAPGWRNTLAVAAALTIIGAAFPRLSSRARWPTRLGLRGRLLYIAFSTAFGFGVRELARHMREDHERAVAELRAELGRDPTDEELHAQLVRRRLRRHLGREPTEHELRDLLSVIRP